MEMNNYLDGFKDRIYNPYTKAWHIMKTLKEADLREQATWDAYMNECDKFKEQYGNTEIGGSIYRVMLDAGSEAKRIWEGVGLDGNTG